VLFLSLSLFLRIMFKALERNLEEAVSAFFYSSSYPPWVDSIGLQLPQLECIFSIEIASTLPPIYPFSVHYVAIHPFSNTVNKIITKSYKKKWMLHSPSLFFRWISECSLFIERLVLICKWIRTPIARWVKCIPKPIEKKVLQFFCDRLYESVA